jgi:hypothetical protein
MKFWRIIFSGFLTVLVFLLAVREGEGQTKPEPPPRRPVELPRDTAAALPTPASSDTVRESRVRYPSFDVPEYTITGEETSALSGMPRPLSADFPSGGLYRSAGMGMRNLDAIASEARRPATIKGNRSGGGARLGYGTFRTPLVDLWLSYVGEQSDMLLNTSYTSTWGHVANAQSQKANAALSGGFGILGTRVRAGIGLNGDGYRLYGSSRPTRWRTVNGFQGDVEVGSIRIGEADLYSGMHFNTTMMEDTLKSTEYQLGFDLNLQAQAGPVGIFAEGEMWTSAYTTNMDVLSPHLFTLSVRGRYSVLPTLDVDGGLRFGVRRGTDRMAIGWVDPLFGVYWRGWPDMTVYLRFEPYAEKGSLAAMVAESPYVTVSPHLRPAHYATNVLAGVEFRPAAGIRSSVELFVLRGHDVPVFVDLDTTGIWTPVYGGVVRSTGFTASVAADFTPDDALHASLTIRQSRWSGVGDGDERLLGDMVPYMPSFQLDAFGLHRFPFGLSIVPSVRLVGSRAVDVRDTRSLTAYLDIGFRAEYIVLPSFTVALSFENIFGTKRTYWDGYPGVPATASLSASYTW